MRGEFINPLNIKRISFKEGNSVLLYFVGDDSSTAYYNVTEEEKKVIIKLVKNDSRTDS